MTRHCVAPLVVFLLVACDHGPRVSVDGLWERGGVSGDHFGNYYLILQADGDDISGYACYTSYDSVLFHDVRVHGDYPSVTFTVGTGSYDSCCAFYLDARFDGRVTGNQTIEGNFGPVNGVTSTITFRRSSAPIAPAGCFSRN